MELRAGRLACTVVGHVFKDFTKGMLRHGAQKLSCRTLPCMHVPGEFGQTSCLPPVQAADDLSTLVIRRGLEHSFQVRSTCPCSAKFKLRAFWGTVYLEARVCDCLQNCTLRALTELSTW